MAASERVQPLARAGRRPPGGPDGEPCGSLADQLFETIKRAIVENRIPADTILAEASVAAQYGVSRAPAREALKRLASSGFVRTVPRLGSIVTSVSLRDFDEIIAMRLVLEPVAVELAVPRATDSDFEQLEALARGVLGVSDEPSDCRGALYAELNADFHRRIARIADNRRLERMISGLIDELERLMHTLAYSGDITLVLDQHLQLIRLMRTGDAAAAALLMRDQLRRDYEVMRGLAAPAVAASR